VWFPWKYIVRRVARAHGFLDPVAVLSRLHQFAQPSEVAEPIELLRAGVVFHARGLMNTRAIQHNLDWVWPYWVERQFDPKDESFIPRAFSITHVNLTHRNWTAIGLPDCDAMPIVDPRGLVTPDWDGWSIDGWLIADDGRELMPSRQKAVSQRLDMNSGLAILTDSTSERLSLSSRAELQEDSGTPICRIEFAGSCDSRASLVVALRPYNPEGVSFIHNIEWDGQSWIIDGRRRVAFLSRPQRHLSSNYHIGDVHVGVQTGKADSGSQCPVGMATAAAVFDIGPFLPTVVALTVSPIESVAAPNGHTKGQRNSSWPAALEGACRFSAPDARFVELYETALRTLVLHSPGEVYPGPYTYKRFWFRDAAFILHALLCAAFERRAERAIDKFSSHQTRAGYFRSQEGEWDSNGQALWIMHRFCELAGRAPKASWRDSIHAGARWIVRKRLPVRPASDHAGLLPAGFSAEHLGPNNYYYWDDFWAIAGLRAASRMLVALQQNDDAVPFDREADDLMLAVERSLETSSGRRDRLGMPASPYRRMDSGAIGSLAVGYPLQLWAADDPRLLDTIEFLIANCFVDGGFFQDMIHSGINPYLSLHVAQVLLRAGDQRFLDIVNTVARLASPTGQWPEAIHPRTGGGCMGDGQHAWAAAEWVLMIRNMFVREEDDRLILASGIPTSWLEQADPIAFGPAPTAFGSLSVSIARDAGGQPRVAWELAKPKLRPRRSNPVVEVRLPGNSPLIASRNEWLARETENNR
jgi:hypothetical protein